MRLFKSDIVEWVLQALKMPDDVPIENKRVSASIASAQSQVEAQNFEIRKNILKYDDVMNRQRHAVYGDRRKVLEGADVESRLRATVDTVVEQYVIGATEGFAEDWDLEQLWSNMNTLYPVSLVRAEYEERDDLDRQLLIDDFKADAQAAYDNREESRGGGHARLERRVLLTVLDRKWREHLYEMDYLREGIGLRAMAQRDPVEYQREGGDMFNVMMEAFMEESSATSSTSTSRFRKRRWSASSPTRTVTRSRSAPAGPMPAARTVTTVPASTWWSLGRTQMVLA